MIPQIIPLISDMPRLHQPASRSPVARCHTVCPHTGSNPITRYRQSSRSPATRRVYASMFRAPQGHGATQTHFPPRPRKYAWPCDITNVASPHGLPTQEAILYHTIPPITPLTSDTPRLRQPVSCFRAAPPPALRDKVKKSER